MRERHSCFHISPSVGDCGGGRFYFIVGGENVWVYFWGAISHMESSGNTRKASQAERNIAATFVGLGPRT